MMKKHTLTALALMTVSGMAWAAGGALSFQELDTNRDGVITLDEAKKSPNLKGNFTQADTNKDGKLDAAEFSALETMPMDSSPMGSSQRDSSQGGTSQGDSSQRDSSQGGSSPSEIK